MSLIDRRVREKIVLVGVVTDQTTRNEVEESLDELSLLIDTAGAEEVARIVQTRASYDPATFIGSGKAEELKTTSYAVDADTVVFDEELTPAQQRNLEKILGRTAIDRTAVILDIFAQNAHTQEGKAQVELAMLKYRLPRLRGRGLALSQQAGGIGTRGPGETQLEVDRRRLQRRMTKLEQDLKELRKKRGTQRKARERSRIFQVSLVGYTNAGKSTLLNRLAEADLLVEDRLFSTLDPATRRMELPGGQALLLSDTVGFVKKLPHQLVEAFTSTLEEVRDADLLLHVVDGSSSGIAQRMAAVRAVLAEIGAGDIPEAVVFNKTDLPASPEAKEELHEAMGARPSALQVSAVTGEGCEQLIEHLVASMRAGKHEMELLIPFDRGDLLAALHRDAEVISEEASDEGMAISARVEQADASKFEEFVSN